MKVIFLKSDDSGGYALIANTLLAKIVASYQKRIKRQGGKGDEDSSSELVPRYHSSWMKPLT